MVCVDCVRGSVPVLVNAELREKSTACHLVPVVENSAFISLLQLGEDSLLLMHMITRA
jgi:hypothetical protein